MTFSADVNLGLSYSRGSTEFESVSKVLEKVQGHIRQEVVGDWNELHNEELRSEFVFFTKYCPMKFRGIGCARI
jgi:hypothetical protein